MTEPGTGGLSEPVRVGAAGPADPPWRDNAFLAFWDESAGLYGCAHVSTSPNSEGRRARCSVAAGGRRPGVVRVHERVSRGLPVPRPLPVAPGAPHSGAR